MRFLIIAYLILLSSYASAQLELRKMELDTSFLQIGEQTSLHLELEWNGVQLDTMILIFQESEKSEYLEIESSYIESILKADLRLTVWDTGIVKLPTLALLAISKSRTDSFVLSTPPILVAEPRVDTTQGIYDIKSNLEQGYTFVEILKTVSIIGGIVFVLIALIYLIVRLRRKKNEEEAVEPGIPPFEVAMTELGRLKDKKMWQAGNIKDYYAELTFILRRYIEHEWKVEALEMTSAEIVRSLSTIPINSIHYGEVSAMLRTADLVKFAKAFPQATDHLKFFELVEECIRDLNSKVVTQELDEND